MNRRVEIIRNLINRQKCSISSEGKKIIYELCDLCDSFEKAADGFGMESIGLKKQIEYYKSENERLKKLLNTDFSFIQVRTGKNRIASQLIRVRVEEIKSQAMEEFVKLLKNEHKNNDGFCVVDDEDLDKLLKSFFVPEKVCTGTLCPMQVGYNVEQCKNKECLFRTE